MNINDGGGDAEFTEFESAGDVEVGESNLATAKEGEDDTGKPKEGEEAPKKKAARGPAKPAAKAEPIKEEEGKGEEKPGEEEEIPGDEEEEGEEEEKPENRARDQQINRLKREKAQLARELREARALTARLDALENRDLPTRQDGGKSKAEEPPAPDVTDTAKYPLGHLDDRYIEDKLEWLAERKATAIADAALHRQQESEQTRAAERQQQDLLAKVDDLAKIGDELYGDFQEQVVETGMRGDWDLSQATFEAAHEVDHGAQILYELSQDKPEASRVAKLSSFQQMKFVQERDAEITKTKTGRKIPKAGAPPENTARGANSKVQTNPATDNLSDFEKAWERDAQGKS